jgi:DNA topoisomerase VI subunit B
MVHEAERRRRRGKGTLMTGTSAATKLHRTTFQTSRLLDFCSQKELIAQVGHQPAEWPLVVLKELMDNALDACEEAKVAPKIAITVTENSITVADNGPGLPAEVIDGVLDFSVRVSSREAYIAPDRGAQGNALKTLIAMPYVLDGASGVVEIEALGIHHTITFSADPIRQVPVINLDRKPGSVHSGTRVTVFLPRFGIEPARHRFVQIAGDFTWLNPHLTLTLDWFGAREIMVEATNPTWAKWRPSDPTSPHWYKPEHFGRLIAAYMSHDEDHGRDRLVREFVTEFRGLARTPKGKAVLEAVGMARAHLSSLRNNSGLDGGAVERLLTAMKLHSAPVKPDLLGIIGREHMRLSFEGSGCEMESFSYKRQVGTTDNLPWVIEVGFGCLKDDVADRRLVTGVNWSPGIINPFRQLGAYGESLDSILTEQRASLDEPIILVLHMACPRVEYTDRGKSAVVIR